MPKRQQEQQHRPPIKKKTKNMITNKNNKQNMVGTKLKYVCVFIFNMQQCCFVSCNSIPCTYLCLDLDVAGSLLVQVCSTTLVDFCIGVCSCLLILSECECLHVIFMASPPPASASHPFCHGRHRSSVHFLLH